MKKASSILSMVMGSLLISCGHDDAPKQLDYYPFPEKNAFWTIARCESSFNAQVGLVKIGIFGDTIINGRTYHKLYGQSKKTDATSCATCDFELTKDNAHYFLSFREENKKIYIVPRHPVTGEPDGAEYLMYDFNITEIGDEITVYPFSFNPLTSNTEYWGGIIDSNVPRTLTVKEISRVKMPDGTHRNVYHFDDAIPEAWIEGIGSTNGFAVFHHIYDIGNLTWGFSSSQAELFDIPVLLDGGLGCDLKPFTYADHWE